MTEVTKLISKAIEGGLNFGNIELLEKSKFSGFEYMGDTYKIKTFNEITKLEKNDLFVYESVPGTNVKNFNMTSDEITFAVEGEKNAQIAIGLDAEQTYKVIIDGETTGFVDTNLGGKLVFSVEFEGKAKNIKIVKFSK